jgi:hypothetical protein
VDEAGKLQIRRDIYGRDATMIGLLKNSRNKDLETLVSHAQPNYSRPKDTLPAGVNFASDNTSSGPSFFERLFGGPSTVTPPAPVGRRPQQRFTR